MIIGLIFGFALGGCVGFSCVTYLCLKEPTIKTELTKEEWKAGYRQK